MSEQALGNWTQASRLSFDLKVYYRISFGLHYVRLNYLWGILMLVFQGFFWIYGLRRGISLPAALQQDHRRVQWLLQTSTPTILVVVFLSFPFLSFSLSPLFCFFLELCIYCFFLFYLSAGNWNGVPISKPWPRPSWSGSPSQRHPNTRKAEVASGTCSCKPVISFIGVPLGTLDRNLQLCLLFLLILIYV